MNDPLVGVLFVIVTVSAILVQNILLGFAKYRKKLEKTPHENPKLKTFSNSLQIYFLLKWL